MTELNGRNRERLVKMLGMLGSMHMGERASAALKVDQFVKDLRLTWDDVIPPEHATTPRPFEWSWAKTDPQPPPRPEAAARPTPEPKPPPKPKKPSRPRPKTPEEKAERKAERERQKAERQARAAREHDEYMRRHDPARWRRKEGMAAMNWADAAAFCLTRRQSLQPWQLKMCTGDPADFAAFRGHLWDLTTRLGWKPRANDRTT